MYHINTISDRNRMSTKELLQNISSQVANGETEFQIAASGQHDIGGSLWNRAGKELHLRIWNPGQRVGGMCLKGTKIIVEGSAPADVGWLNTGGEITIKGDAGDTAGHCAASGCIYIGGRAGTRSGSLMKHDPLYEEPELWVLKSTGSFSFEFMGGGKAVICGHDCLALPSVLGERPGVGMVGGIIYFRGNNPDLPPDVCLKELDEHDITFLNSGLEKFLKAIGKPELKRDLTIWKHWHKLLPASKKQLAYPVAISTFRQQEWIKDGIFKDILEDDHTVVPLVTKGAYRLRIPTWNNQNECTDCRLCIKACPNFAIKRRTNSEGYIYTAKADQCIGCGICAGVCPQEVWEMNINKLE